MAAGLLAALQGCAAPPAPQAESDWERERHGWREASFALPAAPRRENLLSFFVSAASDYAFFVDRATLGVGADGVVRYVLVVRSPQGAQSVSFEGIRCSTREYRIYATGLAGGGWSRAETPWRAIEPRTVKRWHDALWREYFCPLGNPIESAEEGVRALRRGDHPSRERTGD